MMSDAVFLSMRGAVELMRSYGVSMNNRKFLLMADAGELPFVKILRKSQCGVRSYIIRRKDLMDWLRDQGVPMEGGAGA